MGLDGIAANRLGRGLPGRLDGDAFCAETAGSGIPHLKGVLLHLRKLSPWRVIPIKFFGGILSIGSGLSLGREGPTVQIGAGWPGCWPRCFGPLKRTYPNCSRRVPERGWRRRSMPPWRGWYLSLKNCTVSCLPVRRRVPWWRRYADLVTQWLAGNTLSFEVHGLAALPLAMLPLAASLARWVGRAACCSTSRAAGAEGGVGAALASQMGVAGRRRLAGRHGCWWLPDAIGGGHSVAERVLGGTLTAGAGMLALLLVVKLLFTAVSYASAHPGGVFAPMLLLA